METSERLEQITLIPLTLSVEDSPVRISQLQEKAQDSQAKDRDSGSRCTESLANYDLDTSLWRTSADSSVWGSTEFSGPWPKSGMMRSGKLYQQETLVRPTEERGCGLLPTPTRTDNMNHNPTPTPPRNQERHDSSYWKNRQTKSGPIRAGNQGYLSSDSRKERVQRVFVEEIPRFSAFSCFQDVGRLEELRGRPDLPEPLFRGSRDGVPNWMDRIGACGNAVVPQIPEWIANQILKYEASN